MKQVTIHNTPRFECISHGNGLAYTLRHKEDRQEVFFQGGDAEVFRESLEALTSPTFGPQLSYDNALGCIWFDYAESATEWGVRDDG